MIDPTAQLLQEFRAFRDTEFREFRDDVVAWQEASAQRMAVMESSIKSGITGNGTPSRLAKVESDVVVFLGWRADLESWKNSINERRTHLWQLVLGAGALTSAVMAFVGWYWPKTK